MKKKRIKVWTDQLILKCFHNKYQINKLEKEWIKDDIY